MGLRLAALGDKNVLATLMEVVTEYAYTEIEFIPLEYQDERDMEQIVRANLDLADTWLVFGQIDYERLKNAVPEIKDLYYVSYRGASIYKVLGKLLNKGYKADDISYDTVPLVDIDRGLKEMEIEHEPTKLLVADCTTSLETYIEFHKRQKEQNGAKVAITASLYVQQRLRDEGYAAEYIYPIRVSIRSIINKILSAWRIKALQDSQIAVQVLKYDLYTEKDGTFQVDDVYSMELTIAQGLIKYARNLQGSLKPIGQGVYFIFTTRGMLQEQTADFTKTIYYLGPELLSKNLLACGIGLGQNAKEAETNALFALRLAEKAGEGAWFAVQEDKVVKGPLGHPEALTYAYGAQHLKEVAIKTGLNSLTLNKLYSLQKKQGKEGITAKDAAVALNVLPRSARRLLAVLEEHGYVEELAEEAASVRGRPRKMYILKMK